MKTYDETDPINEAVRILTDAGYGPAANPHFDPNEDHDCPAKAVWWLFRHEAEWNRAEAKARKSAEDAKVWEFFEAIGGKPSKLEEHHRELYRKSRDHFKGDEKPAPRVINYGDPEPDRSTKWRGGDGKVFRYFPEDGGWGYTCGFRWDDLGKFWFPMTEVTA